MSLRILLIFVYMVLLGACSNQVRTQLNAFQAEGASLGSGTIAVFPVDKDLANSLEFKLYKTRLEDALSAKGYTIVQSEAADYRAELAYSVEERQPKRRGTYYDNWRGYYGFSWGLGHHHHYPRSRVGLAYSVREIDRFDRTLSMDIYQVKSSDKVYEIKAVSTGNCAIMSVVFDEMLEAVFTEFPYQNGIVRSVTVEGDTRCE